MRFETKYNIGNWIRFKRGGNIVEGEIGQIRILHDQFKREDKTKYEVTFIEYVGFVDGKEDDMNYFEVYEDEVIKKVSNYEQDNLDSLIF